MSKNIGIASFDTYQNTQEQYDALGNSILEQQSQELSTQLQVFQNALLNYSKEHSKEILENPKFRSEFSKICSSFGIDPGNLQQDDNSELKNDEYYHQICIRIIEICHETKDNNGGIMLINDELLTLLKVNFDKISLSDVLQAVENLQIMGDELKLIQIGPKKYLKSIPHELNTDENVILETCSMISGYVSVSMLRANFQWDKIRCQTVLDDMVSNGLLWLDTQDPYDDEIIYWLPHTYQ